VWHFIQIFFSSKNFYNFSVSDFVAAIGGNPWNIPLWMNLARLPVTENELKISRSFYRMTPFFRISTQIFAEMTFETLKVSG